MLEAHLDVRSARALAVEPLRSEVTPGIELSPLGVYGEEAILIEVDVESEELAPALCVEKIVSVGTPALEMVEEVWPGPWDAIAVSFAGIGMR